MNSTFRQMSDFVNSTIPPQYACLLLGKWGAGKTWEVTHYAEELRKTGTRVIYISLNGFTSIDQITSAIFADFHPVLGSKAAKVSKQLFYAVFKAGLKVDISEFATANVGFDFSGIFQESSEGIKDCIIIFDDFERSSIDCNATLGYISNLTVIDAVRVIVVACETEELTSNKSYKAQKEKVFGKTIPANPNFEAAFDSFIKEINIKAISDHLISNKSMITRILEESKSDNIRLLRHSILEWYWFVNSCGLVAKIADLSELMGVFFPLCIESKQNSLSKGDLGQLIHSRFSQNAPPELVRNKEKLSKYSTINVSRLILDPEIWDEIFFSGKRDKDKVNLALERYGVINKKEPPAWYIGWEYLQLSQQEIDSVIPSLEQSVFRDAKPVLGEFLHSSAILISMARFGIYNRNPETLARRILARVRKLKNSLNWQFDLDAKFGLINHYAARTYLECDQEPFKQLRIDIFKLREKAEESATIEKLVKISSSLGENIAEFGKMIGCANGSINELYSVPILLDLPIAPFVKYLQESDHESCIEIWRILKSRYEYGVKGKEPEAQWLMKLGSEIFREGNKNKGVVKLRMTKLYSKWIIALANEINLPARKIDESSNSEITDSDVMPV